MKVILLLLLQADIEQKIKDAPDSSYEIGVTIGAYLPVIVLVAFVYAIYYVKKKNKES
ncbi:hypothetical protein GCM10011414_06060 [Croceivirga lutea]|uniref:hypothetical protein n=1 Tax=Croceivirga lutea TaxID=1775167 RepID=UPI00163A2EE1|nr:hypothetical protein [Croceivirga lutea]GGG39475.1 hypothetical protein GCM10011414_06060 [Croceivirga lutea]